MADEGNPIERLVMVGGTRDRSVALIRRGTHIISMPRQVDMAVATAANQESAMVAIDLERYTRRTIHCGGRRVDYLAIDTMEDDEALWHVLYAHAHDARA